MNKEKLYKHNGYGFSYDSDFKDGSCLTIVKSKKDTLEVLTNIFGESANAINGILEYQQQELERYKNIIDEALGIANERINYYYYAHKQIEAEDWSEIFDVLIKRDNQELKGSDE